MKSWVQHFGARQPLLPRTSSGSGGVPRVSGDGGRKQQAAKWERWYIVSLTVAASALLSILAVVSLLNIMLVSDHPLLSPLPPGTGSSSSNSVSISSVSSSKVKISSIKHSSSLQESKATAPRVVQAMAPAEAAGTPPSPHPPKQFHHLASNMRGIYALPSHDDSPRCQQSGICDGDHSCGPDKLGCVTSAKERQDHVRKAISWSWEGYRKYAWGQDEVDVLTKAPKAWFNLGLTIVDSLDTLLIAGLDEEYQQARHWVANHLEFKDGNKVQFFEVNIRILGGLLSAYYLSHRDEMYLHKAQALADRLMVAFKSSSGIANTFVQLMDAAGRSKSGISDGKSNLAEAGTSSMEFTTIGRLLGRDDLSDAGMHFWDVIQTSQNFTGLYCMGIHTKNGECTDPKLTIGSAADSMYEYMLKQWLLSGKTQEVPLQLYKAAMQGVRKHLVRHVFDGTAEMSYVSEASANKATGVVEPVNDRFEHLTCFAGGMFVLGKLHNISTDTSPGDYDDITLGARIGRACYELYHQSPSGVAPDSVHYQNKAGGNLPNSVPVQAAKRSRRLTSHPADISKHLLAVVQQQPQLQKQNQVDGNAGNKQGGTLQLLRELWAALQQLTAGLATSASTQQPSQQQQWAAGSPSKHEQGNAAATSTAAVVSTADAAAATSRHILATDRLSTSTAAAAVAAAAAAAAAPSAPVAAQSSPSPVAAPSSTSPPQPPPPIVASWTQQSKADFLRPEAIETLFYLWRATGDEIYREWGWNMFRAFEKYCRLGTGGYATVADVNQAPPQLANKMESFWLAETLKYFYLLFEDDPSVVPLDEWVFNTEAHPLPVWGTAPDMQAMQRTKERQQAAAQEKAAEQLAAHQQADQATGAAKAVTTLIQQLRRQ